MQTAQSKNKIIYLISPERWGSMKVSKHNYALALAEKSNEVFFIEPPDLKNKGIRISLCPDHSRIHIVQYRPMFRGRTVLPKAIYRFLLKEQVRRLIKAIGKKPDQLWCFQGYLFQNLQWFKANETIFFAADQFYYEKEPPELDTTDLNLAVSDTIYKRIKKDPDRRAYQINHGLQKPFVDRATHLLKSRCFKKVNDKIVAGYTGNLLMEAMDRKTMRNVIETNPFVKFIFWGAYEKAETNLGAVYDSAAVEFIDFLKNSNNVVLRGVVNGEQLQMEMQQADLFWICWKTTQHKLWDGSNSHKLLEYLSTGCPVVSHYVSSYAGKELIYMLETRENINYRVLFAKVLDIVQRGEPDKIVEQRLYWAIENSYEKQLDRIEKLIGGRSS